MRLLLTSLVCVTLALPVVAKPALRDVAEIDDALMAVAIADELRKDCDGISARMLRALSRLEGLKGRARDLGYTKEEVKAYVTSDAEKQRMRAKATAWLAKQGVDPTDSVGFCAFGRDQIKAKTAIGSLLR